MTESSGVMSSESFIEKTELGGGIEDRLWNRHRGTCVPAALQRPEMTLHTFKQQLKIYLFHIRLVDQQK